MSDNQKMREALGVVIDACDTVFKMAHDSAFVEKWAVSVRSVATDALAAPPEPVGNVAKMRETLLSIRGIVNIYSYKFIKTHVPRLCDDALAEAEGGAK